MSTRSTEGPVQETILPLVEEQLDIEIRQNVTGAVRLDKKVYTRDAVIEQEVMRECLSIERVAVNRILDEPIGVRKEGTVTIIPVTHRADLYLFDTMK
jgi:stress response protein YsnF